MAEVVCREYSFDPLWRELVAWDIGYRYTTYKVTAFARRNPKCTSIPAFRNSISSLCNLATSSLPTLSTATKSVRSHSPNSTRSVDARPLASHPSHASSNLARLRANTTTCSIPCKSSCLTISAPMPLCPPVTTAVFPVSGGHSASVHLVVFRSPNW